MMNWLKKDPVFLKKCFFLTVLFLSVNGVLAAQNRTHMVTSGETLFSIARAYNTSVSQLKEWNNLSGNEIEVGQLLIVGMEESGQPGNAIAHKVQAQETLFSISKQYGVNIAEIKAWNNLPDNTLEIGQQLTIYPSNETPGAPESESQPLIINTTAGSNTYYTVKSGDTLYRIALQHNMSVDELKALNDLASNTIGVGQRLTVKKTQSAPSVSRDVTESFPQGKFVLYTVKEPQNLQSVLEKFDMDEAEFHALNPGIGSSSFQQGQKITVLTPPSRTYENPYTKQASLKNLGETVVSVYDSSRVGTTTTSGDLYNPDQLTAAHSNIALGDVIFVQNPDNNKGIYVRINDRFSGNGLKLSHAALRSLGLTSTDATVNIYQDQ